MRLVSKKVLVVVLIISIQGCVAPISYQTVIPEIPKGTKGAVNKSLIDIKLSELAISAQVQAFDWDGRHLPPPLGVWVNIKPLKGPLTLQTLQIRLRVDEGDELAAISYLGPDVKWFSPRAFAAGCGPRFYRTGIGITRNSVTFSQISITEANNNVGIFRPSDEPISIESESCFIFWFDTSSLPNHAYVLTIDGLKSDNNIVLIPDIHFKQGEVTDWRGFP